MTTNVITVNPDTDINTATKLMAEQQIRRLPVVENDKLVGMVSLGDLATNMNWNTEISEALSEISTPSKPENLKDNK
jgi:predicted transcriptional regulator